MNTKNQSDHTDKNGGKIDNTLSTDLNEDQLYIGIYSKDNKYFNGHDAKKNFLHDAPYETIHIINLEVNYQLPNFPLGILFSYGFSYNEHPVNNGITSSTAEVHNIFSLSFKLYM